MGKNGPGKDLQILLLGLAMLAGGLYLLFQSTRVESAPLYWGLFGNISIPSGIVVIPLILGVVLMVIFSDKIWPRIFTGLAVLLIVLAIISSVRIRFETKTLFVFILMLLLIFIGAALCLKILLSDKYSKDEKKEDKEKKNN